MSELNDPWLIAPFLALLGAMFGSFANVVIYRLPKGESLAFPGSHCFKCGKPVRWFDNVPILAWFWLKGRCRHCKEPFSFRYPFVEFLMAALFSAIYLKTGMSWLLLEYEILAFGLVVITFIDLDHFIIPDSFSLGGCVLGLIGGAINPEREFLDSVYGLLAGGGFLWAVAVIYQKLRKEEGMGGGDIKLLGWIGAVLGWKAIPFVILCSSVVGSVVGLAIASRGDKGLKTIIPFGPYLAGSALIYLLGGHRLGEWYIQLFFPDL